MNGENPKSDAGDLKAHRLQGFAVRQPAAQEIPVLDGFFPNNPLGNQNVLYLGAFGQPGDVALGAAIVRAVEVSSKNIGEFLLFVRADCRRRKIGTMLMRHLYSLALANNADRMILPDLVHQDRADNAFYLACGLVPDKALNSYSVEIRRALDFCEPIVEHFRLSDAQMAGVKIVSQNTLDLREVADFFSSHLADLPGRYLADLRAGVYDLSLCSAAVREGKIISAGLGRSKAGVSSVIVDLILTAPAFRNGPVSLAILEYSARLALQRNLTHCVFEADERYDRFAVGFARRCGAKAQWKRYRYSIGREQMREWLDKKS